MQKISTRLNFLHGRKKVEPENIFPVFPVSFCSKVYYLPVFPETFLKTGNFPVFPARVDTLQTVCCYEGEISHCFKYGKIANIDFGS